MTMSYAELEAKMAHLDNDRRILWYARKCLLSLVERLETEAKKLRRELAIERKVSSIIECTSRESLGKLDEEIAFLRKALAYQVEMRESEQKQHERQLQAAYKKLHRSEQTIQHTQADCLKLESVNEQLRAQMEELMQQVEDQSFRIAECEKMISSQQATLAARPPVFSWAPSGVTPKLWSLPAQNARISELVAEKEVLTEQLASVQQEKEELQQQSQQLQEALEDAEVCEGDQGLVNKRVVHLEEQNLQLEADKEELAEQLASVLQQKEELQQQSQQLQEALEDAEVCEWDQGLVNKRVVHLEEQNLQLEADKEELAEQLASVLQQKEVLQQQSQQLQEALQETEVCEWDQGLVNKRVVQLEEQNLQLEAEKEELAEQLGSLQQQKEVLQQQSKQLQEALSKAERDQWESSMAGKQVADLGVKNLLMELDLDNATAKNQQLQDLVADLRSQLQSLQAKNNMDKQHQAVAASDPLAAAQAGLKPVAVSSPSSSVQDSQPDQPDTPELSELELSSCSSLSSGQSSRRTSEVCQPCSPESCSSSSSSSAARGSSTSGAWERINSLHPLYGYWSWVQDSSSQ